MPDDPVLHLINCIKHPQCSLVMSHDNHSRTMLAGDIAEKFHDLPAAVGLSARITLG